MNEDLRGFEKIEWTVYEAGGVTRINFVTESESDRHTFSWTLTTPSARKFFRDGDRQLNRASWRRPRHGWPAFGYGLALCAVAVAVMLFIAVVVDMAVF